jgi:hypothetical protein
MSHLQVRSQSGKPLENLLDMIIQRDGKLTREFTFKLLRDKRNTTLTIKAKKAA